MSAAFIDIDPCICCFNPGYSLVKRLSIYILKRNYNGSLFVDKAPLTSLAYSTQPLGKIRIGCRIKFKGYNLLSFPIYKAHFTSFVYLCQTFYKITNDIVLLLSKVRLHPVYQLILTLKLNRRNPR